MQVRHSGCRRLQSAGSRRVGRRRGSLAPAFDATKPLGDEDQRVPKLGREDWGLLVGDELPFAERAACRSAVAAPVGIVVADDGAVDADHQVLGVVVRFQRGPRGGEAPMQWQGSERVSDPGVAVSLVVERRLSCCRTGVGSWLTLEAPGPDHGPVGEVGGRSA